MINKYLDPKWVKNLKDLCTREVNCMRSVASQLRNTKVSYEYLTLENPDGEIEYYMINDVVSYNGKYEWSLIMELLDGDADYEFSLIYNERNGEITIFLYDSDTDTDIEYKIVKDINPEWKLLQLAKMRLAFAMSLNERLGRDSDLIVLSPDIIEKIGVNINREESVPPPVIGMGSSGGGYVFKDKRNNSDIVRYKKKKIKSKKKRKTKRRKSKRKKHKTKKRKY